MLRQDINIIELIKKLRRLTNMRLEYKKCFAVIVVAFCFIYILRKKLPEKASVLDHNTTAKSQNEHEVKTQIMEYVEKHGGKRLSKIKQNCGEVCRTDQNNSIDLENFNRSLGRCFHSRFIIKKLS